MGEMLPIFRDDIPSVEACWEARCQFLYSRVKALEAENTELLEMIRRRRKVSKKQVDEVLARFEQ